MCPTALIKIFIGNEFVGLFRTLGDSGATPNLVAHHLVKKRNLQTSPVRGSIMGISSNPVQIRQKIMLNFLPWFVPNYVKRVSATFHILPKGVKWEPNFPSNNLSCHALSTDLKGPLADPFFWQSAKIGMLFGVELFASIIEGYAHKLDSSLISQESNFGHWIYGRAGEEMQKSAFESISKPVHIVDLKELDRTLQKLWEFDDLSMCTEKDAEHELIERMFQQSHHRDENGRFIVKIPLKPNITELGSSREVALKRFFMLEKRFERDPIFYKKYSEFMSEYEQLGHMIEANKKPEPNEMCYHIPHHKIAISSDISKMHRQVKVVQEQWNLQRIFW